ncbi:MAG: hypothetical protein JWN40_366 [Phycisphaerales bacterium]|nr:hypothetical protein [Phycisphaerales bacterium]
MTFQIEALESRQFLSAAAPNIAPDVSRLIFTQPMNTTSRAQYLTLRNTGSAALALNSISVTGADANQFYLRRKGLPASLKPGESASLKVTFTPTAAAVRGATLEIASNDPDAPLISVALRGLGTGGLFNAGEPSLQRILDTLQIPVNVGDATPATSHLDGPGASDELPMQLLKKAGPGVVRITPLAAFSWDFFPVAHFGWFRARGSVVTRELLNIPGGNSQTLMPASAGTKTFDPGTVNFGLYSNWPVEQHGSVYTQDALNTWDTTSDNKHKVRFYPYRKPSGKTVPNTYVMAIEQAFNSDFQDAVLVIENVQPYNAVTAPINIAAAATSPASIHLSWTDNNAYESSYIIERSRSKNGTFSVIGTTGAGASSFDDAHLASNTLYYYRVRAANVTGASDPSLRAVARTAI